MSLTYLTCYVEGLSGTDLYILDSGGGIGGLAFAVSLSRCEANVDVDIYESAARFSEIGAGLAMWPRVWDIMRIIGLEEDLKRRIPGEKGM